MAVRPRAGQRRRLLSALAAFVLMLAMVVATPGTASASTGGTATGDGLDGEILALEVLGVPVTDGLLIDLVSVGTPAANAAGVGTETDSILDASLLGVVEADVVSATTVRTTDGLSSSADVSGVSVNLFGVELVGVGVIGSQVSCPIDELPGLPTASVDPLVGLTVGGAAVEVGATTSVPVDIGVLGVNAFVDVTVTQPVSTTTDTASATGLAVDANLRVVSGGLTILDVVLIDLDIAATSCSRPAGEVPAAVSLTPTSGPEGTVVTVSGTGFIPGQTSVNFGGLTIAPADVTVNTLPADEYGTSLTFAVPDDAPLGDTAVSVTTPVGTSTPDLNFTVTSPPPTATSLTPTSGTETTVVTVFGADFVPGATTVTIAGLTVAAADVDVALDGSSLQFAVPVGAPLGATTVVATTDGGSTGPLDFTVLPFPPTTTSLTPDEGPEGTTVTVTGTEFVPGETSVSFGGTTIDAADVDVAVDGNSLSFEVPDDSPLGDTDVVVNTPGGSSDPLTFTVTEAPPTATSLSPTAGPELTVVTVDGDNFVPGETTITFGGVTIPATDVDVAPDGNSLTFEVPDDAPLGATDVVVNTPGGSSDPLTFTVTEAPPTATSLSPTEGPELTVVTVNGDNFVPGATTVDFGSVTIPAADVTVAADGNSLTFEVPDDSPLGDTDVVVNTDGGSTDPLTFTVTAAVPVATDLTPPSGTEGTAVMVNGDNFIPGDTTVQLGSITIPAADVDVAPDGNSLTFEVPVGTPLGTTPVVVTTDGGSTEPLTFVVIPFAPTAASLTPDEGPEDTVVTVTGTNFVPDGTTVLFGTTTIPATAVTVAPDGNSLTFVVPENSPLGPTTVVASTDGGSTGPLDFTVTAVAPTATSLTPPSGPEGTVVTVHGDHFLSGLTTVQLGSTTIPADAVTVSLDGNMLTFVVPDDFPLGPTTVVATTPGGSTAPLAFTVTAGVPVITGITPAEGPVGTTVTIIGDNFIPGETAVVIGDTLLPPGAVTVSPDGDSLTFVVPIGTPIGAQRVVVVTDGGSSAPATFTVTGPGAPVSTDGTLPYTGSDTTGPLVTAGLLLALLGFGLWSFSSVGRPVVARALRRR